MRNPLLAFALSLTLASSASAMSNADWLKRVYNDVLYRDPTSAEVASALPLLALANPSHGFSETRWAVAGAVLYSEEYRRDLLGANPAIPGWFQILLGKNPTSAQIALGLQRFTSPFFADDGAIYALVGVDFVADYVARAQALNQGLTACGGDQSFINQLFVDLLGRNATSFELSGLGYSTALSYILLPPSVTNAVEEWQKALNHEYRQRQVRTAFVRYLHREPQLLPFTAPDLTASEMEYFVAMVGGQLIGVDSPQVEGLVAYLLASAEYDGGGVLAAPPPRAPPRANVLVTNQIVGVPNPDASPALSIGQGLPPTMLTGILISSSQTVHTLLVQSAADEATIGALVADELGGQVTGDASLALLQGAQDKFDEARILLFPPCPPDRECAPGVAAAATASSTSQEQKDRKSALVALQHAEANLALGYAAQAEGHFETAARDARRAYSDAVLAEREASHSQDRDGDGHR